MNNYIEKITTFVSNHLTILIFIVMLLGLANGYIYGGISFNIGICAAASFLMIYPMFINLKIEDITEIKFHKLPIIISIIINFLISPLIAYILGLLFLNDEPFMKLGLMLVALIPTSGMTATWTERSKGNLKVALAIIAVSLILVIISLPLLLPLLAENILEVTPWFIFQRIILVIIFPLTLGDITRRLIIAKRGLEYFKKKKPLFSGLSSTGLLIVLFLIMSLDANTMLINHPLLTIKSLIPLIFYYAAMFILSTALTYKFDYSIAIAIVFGTSVRYLALALGIVIPLLGNNTNSSLVVLVVALAFFVQVPFASFYSRWAVNKKMTSLKSNS